MSALRIHASRDPSGGQCLRDEPAAAQLDRSESACVGLATEASAGVMKLLHVI